MAGGNVGKATRGPVGANGQRPMLGGRGAGGGGAAGTTRSSESQPSYRVPGASVAARAAAAGAGSWADTVKSNLLGGTVTPPAVEGDGGRTDGNAGGVEGLDDDGFQTVSRRKARKASQGGGTASAHRDGAATDDQEGTHAGDCTTNDVADDQEDAEGQPTTAELHKAWLDEVAIVRRLRQQGLQGEHPAMVAACAARDAAEKHWRGSKEPAPTSVRLGRAQDKLDRAVSAQAEARQAMLEAERLHREHMQGLQDVLDEATERVRVRRSQLSEIQDEVATGGSSGRAHTIQQRAMHQVHDTICGEVGPTIAALVEQLDSSTPAWAALNGLLGKLSTSKEILESACGGTQRAQTYDIGNDGADQWEGHSEWSESHERDDGPGRAADTPRGAGRHEWAMDVGADCQGKRADADAGDWWGGPARRWSSSTRWQECGHGHWSRASWADQMEVEGDDADEEGRPPAPARRRLEPSDDVGHDDGAQADRQPACMDAEARKRQHTERVSRIVSMAIDSGVNPITEHGEELILLDPPRLDAWVAEHLPSALLC